jgi:hypothetical protein
MDLLAKKEELVQQHNGLMNQAVEFEGRAKRMREAATEIRGQVQFIDLMLEEGGAEDGAPTNGSGKKEKQEGKSKT